MKFFQALFYPFQRWEGLQRLALPLLVAGIPIIGNIAMKGYEYEISINVRYRSEQPVPVFGNMWERLKRGFVIRIAGIAYNIPNYILFAISLFLWIRLFVRFFGLEVRNFQTFGALFGDTLGPRLALIGLAILVSAITNTLFWSGYIRYIETGEFRAFFEVFRNIAATFTNFIDDFLTIVYIWFVSVVLWLTTTVVGIVVGASGIGLPLSFVVFPAITLTLLTTFRGHLFGQLTRRYFGEALPPPQPAAEALPPSLTGTS